MGLDHLLAITMVDDVRKSGGTITEFESCCGGLPSPEAANNPWRYKFSWSPRGALMASRLPARFLEAGEVRDVPGPELFAHFWPYEVEGVGRFEMYPNRDSLPYIDLYGLDGIDSMLRGTIRYPGWCETLKALADLGLLDSVRRNWEPGTTYARFLSTFVPAGAAPLRERLAARLGVEPGHAILDRLAWAGLLSDDPLPRLEASPLGVLVERFQVLMAYREGERDMVLQRHQLTASWPDRPSERRISLLVAYGEPDGDSATSRTVSLPAAVAGRLALESQLHLPGVHIPNTIEIARPILDELRSLGIAFKEWSEPCA